MTLTHEADDATNREADDTAPTVVEGKRRATTPTDSRGLIIGRYQVLGRLGHGGMGVVYRAYDPELDRHLALKLLRVRSANPARVALARERLLREAQALAQLDHPNVVSVYDAGSHGDRVFLAMELVEGTTLKHWLRVQQRSIPEILGVFVQAGRGLAAAHRAGLIHRDFKPSNIMVGQDGKARVLDFGLARAAELGITSVSDTGDEDDGSGELPLEEVSTTEHRLHAQLTAAGTVMGTPTYMSPEQHLGLEIGTASDQFSFCVALYEALYRQRPFQGDDQEQLKHEIVDGRISDPPADSKVPAWLHRVVEHGMANDPGDRFPTMDVLLEELERDRKAPYRRLAAVVIAAVVVGFAALGVLSVTGAKKQLCRSARGELAGVWDDAVQTQVRKQFEKSKRPYAADTFQRVKRILDRYSDDWVAMHAETCRATRVRGTQSDALMDLRMQCLTSRRDELRALTRLFAQAADGAVIDRAVRASLLLTPLSGCADERALTAAVPPPTGARVRKRVAELRRKLLRAGVLENAGHYKEALKLATDVCKAADVTGYLPLQVAADYRRSSLEQDVGHAARAEKLLYKVTRRAARIKRDHIEARAWIDLIGIIGGDRARYAEALALRKVVRDWIVRAGDEPLLRALLHSSVATILWQSGRYDEAIHENKQAIAIRQTALRKGDPELAVSFNNLGNVYYSQGHYDKARPYYKKALQIWTKALGPNHPNVSLALMNLANVAIRNDQFERAGKLNERALAIKIKQLGPNHPRVATSLSNMGEALKAQGQWKRALALQRRALAIWKKSKGPAHPYTAVGLHNIADTLLQHGDNAGALKLETRALAIFEKSLGKTHPYVAFALTNLGRAERHLGHLEKAQSYLERALAVREAKKGAAQDLALTQLTLARVLWARHHHKRAVAMARQARDNYHRAGKQSATFEAQAAKWLDKHRAL